MSANQRCPADFVLPRTVFAAAFLTVLAAVIIGGTALSGGKGSVIGAIVGSLLLGIINNGLVLLGLDSPQQLLFRGALIVFAVALSARSGARM